MARLKEENAQLRYQKEVSERDYRSVMTENTGLVTKLENLENIFVGSPIQKMGGAPAGAEHYAASKVEAENSELKKRILQLEEEKSSIKTALYDSRA